VSGFACGISDLDDYLRKRALANHLGGASRCYVTCADGRVVGYYALASASVARSGVSGRLRRNMPDPLPVVLLSRLAVDRRAQGHGLGSGLLRDAILRTVQAAGIIGVRALLVHASSPAAVRFYRRFDFEPSPTDPMHLLLPLGDARQIMDAQLR
jgi:GNAT superfamily N-acetyltransferase